MPAAPRLTVDQIKSFVEQTEAQLGRITTWTVLDNGLIGTGTENGWYAEYCISFDHGGKEGGTIRLSLDLSENEQWLISELQLLHPKSVCETRHRE